MQQRGVVFSTTLTVKECANIFRSAADSARGGMRKMLEVGATIAGNRDATGYYTPPFDSPFAAVDGVPDFAIGVNILKFSGGAGGNGTHVHMYVDDGGSTRSVQLVSKHGLLDGARSARLTRQFLQGFQSADQRLKITDSNI